MNIFDKEFRAYLKLKNKETDYVWLREDENGRYIEYVFIDGAPEDNRCLSWYVKPHPTYSERHNGWPTPLINKDVDKIYQIEFYCCGHEKDTDPETRCTPGHPRPACGWHKDGWRYDEPVKCACYNLMPVNINNVDFTIRGNELEEYNKILATL